MFSIMHFYSRRFIFERAIVIFLSNLCGRRVEATQLNDETDDGMKLKFKTDHFIFLNIINILILRRLAVASANPNQVWALPMQRIIQLRFYCIQKCSSSVPLGFIHLIHQSVNRWTSMTPLSYTVVPWESADGPRNSGWNRARSTRKGRSDQQGANLSGIGQAKL